MNEFSSVKTYQVKKLNSFVNYFMEVLKLPLYILILVNLNFNLGV